MTCSVLYPSQNGYAESPFRSCAWQPASMSTSRCTPHWSEEGRTLCQCSWTAWKADGRCTMGHTSHNGGASHAPGSFLLQQIGFELAISAPSECVEICRLRCALQTGSGPRSAVTEGQHSTLTLFRSVLRLKACSVGISAWFVRAPVHCLLGWVPRV